MSKLTIAGTIVNHDGEFDGVIVIDQQSGLIESVSDSKTSNLSPITYNLDPGCLIFPGFTDLHVHCREDMSGAHNYKEDFKTASEAALHGGVTQMCDMPNNPVPPVDDASYAAKEALVREHSKIPVVLYAGIELNTKPLSRSVPYKVYMGASTNASGFKSLAEVEAAVARYQGKTITFHCDDPEILEQHKTQPTHEAQRPPEAEINAVDFALKMIAKYDLTGKLCHVSTKKAVDMVRSAKSHGSRVTAEVAPHHMFFDISMLTDVNRQWLRINPPMRSVEDRLAVLEGLRDGTLDYLATDHSPHTKEDKANGASGMPLLDTFGPFAAYLMSEHGFKATDIARVASYNPGLFFSPFFSPLSSRATTRDPSPSFKFGLIAPGYAGSLTIIDMKKPWKVAEKDLKTKSGWSPFTGFTFPGSVRFTISLGRVLYQSN